MKIVIKVCYLILTVFDSYNVRSEHHLCKSFGSVTWKQDSYEIKYKM